MDDYEAIQAMYAIREVLASDAMNFISIMSAYLAVAYVVGKRLSRFQVWSISCLYTVWVAAPATATYIALRDVGALNEKIAVGHLDANLMVQYPIVLPLLMSLSWLVSIVFMLQTRKAREP